MTEVLKATVKGLTVSKNQLEAEVIELSGKRDALKDEVLVSERRKNELIGSNARVETERNAQREQLEKDRQEFDEESTRGRTEIEEKKTAYEFLTKKVEEDVQASVVRTEELRQRQQELESRDAVVGKREAEVDRKQGELDKITEDLGNRETGLDLRSEQLDQRQKDLCESDVRLSNQRTELNKERGDFVARLAASEEELKASRAKIVARESSLNTEEAQIKGREGLVNLAVSKEVANTFYEDKKVFDAEKAAWERKKLEREETIKLLEKQATEVEERIEAGKGMLEGVVKREGELGVQEKSLADKESSLEAAKKDLAYEQALFRTKLREAKMEEVINDSKPAS